MKIETAFTALAFVVLSMACNRRRDPSSSTATSATVNAAEAALPAAEPAAASAPTPDESRETPFPKFVPAVPSPSVNSDLPCPAGTKVYRTDSSVFCAKKDARWGAGRHGPALTFHPNGKLELHGDYRDGRGIGGFYRFRDDGQLESYVEYDGDDEHGLRITFHPNGKRNTEGRYEKGKRVGVHKMWTEDGELWQTTNYDSGRLVSTKTFDVKLRTMSPSEVESEMAKVKALEAQQKKMLDGMQKK